MGVQFITQLPVPIAGAYARINTFYTQFPAFTTDPVTPTRASATAQIYASVAHFQAGAPPLPGGTVQLAIDLDFPIADETALRAEFDDELLVTVGALPGFVSGEIIADPSPPVPPPVPE